MRVLLIYPECPDTFWGFSYALPFISKKATYPPLGLLTVAAMLPKNWEMKITDMNVNKLTDADIKRVDLVFIGAMSIQRQSAKEVIARCKRLGTKIVAGGPLFTCEPESFQDVDYLVLNEAEITLPQFLADLAQGCAKHIYTSNEFADLEKSPIPMWSLIDKKNMKKYALMAMQFSRGCPFMCDFCNITALFGHKVRTKTEEQMLDELEALYLYGWRGRVFMVDDNFIGNKEAAKKIIRAMIGWMKKRKYPFSFNAQVSINIADDEELMNLMVEAGFTSVFIGIETPNEESLKNCGKMQNTKRDLLACIRQIQQAGLEVQGGFIVGFDEDPPSIFKDMIDFIQQSRIVIAMVGLLNAPRGTRLYEHLKIEGRLIDEMSGDNTDGSTNIIPVMGWDKLREGYRSILEYIYSPPMYYQRIMTFLKAYKQPKIKDRFEFEHILAFFRTVYYLGIKGAERVQYWKLLFWTLTFRPRMFTLAITLAIYGHHFREIFEL